MFAADRSDFRYAPHVLPRNALIGMVHVAALPGTPHSRLRVDEIFRRAADEARVLAKAGFDAMMIENMHDRPYVNGPHGPETVALMTLVALAVREAAPNLPLGVQILSLGHKESLAVALAAGAEFIRVENFVFAHVADEGLMPNATAPELLRYRKAIGAMHIKIFADIKKKHASHALTADLSIAQSAHAAEFFGADGVIVTGAFTGEAASEDDLAQVRAATRLPVLVGSGVTPAQVRGLFKHADALIVGSSIKRGGVWSNPVDLARAKAIVRARR
ncbi:hypothetical protein PHYC_03740 [Phycisphaerales bacterium]|nr:hypothetical protein PHYC_03740 [Phycisphaerales bacterium]